MIEWQIWSGTGGQSRFLAETWTVAQRQLNKETLMAAKAAKAAKKGNGETRFVPPEHEQIASLAFMFWQTRGCPHGSPQVDWLQAEQSLTKTLTDKVFDVA